MKGEAQKPISHESQAAGVDLDRFRTRSYTRDIQEIKDTGGKVIVVASVWILCCFAAL